MVYFSENIEFFFLVANFQIQLSLFTCNAVIVN